MSRPYNDHLYLSSLNNPSVIPSLQKALTDPVPEVDLAAAPALYGLKQSDGKAFLLDALQGNQKTTSGFHEQREEVI
jgi:HEAT repeat protein